jgi:hypothetical protein
MGSVELVERSCHFMSASVCGLDALEDSAYATILNDKGNTVDQTRMSNEKVFSYPGTLQCEYGFEGRISRTVH